MGADADLHATLYAALLAALTAAGAYIAVPVGPVPIVLQNLFVMLTGILLGPRWGLASVGAYLLAGVCGLPVFAGGAGGFGRLLGPTGGYLMGYLPAVAVVGWISEKGGRRVLFDVAAMICGALVVYACGLAWLLGTLPDLGLRTAFFVGMLPFLPGDALKIAAAVPIARAVRPVMARGAAPNSAGGEVVR